MLSEDVQSYTAAECNVVPKLPLSEELEIIAVEECVVYESWPKWRYEYQKGNVKDSIDMKSSFCSCIDVGSIVESVYSSFITSAFDIENHDLKLEVDHQNNSSVH